MCNCLWNISFKINNTTVKITSTIGPKLNKTSVKDNPVAPLIIMMVGSPIDVASPPIFALKTSVNKNGIAFKPNVSVITKVTGAINKMVVTLSSKADETAVIIAK